MIAANFLQLKYIIIHDLVQWIGQAIPLLFVWFDYIMKDNS